MSVTVRLSKTLDKSAKLTHKQTTKMICVLWSDVIELKQFRHQKRAWMNRPEQSGHCQHRAATTQHWTISHRFLPNQKNYVMEGMRASFCLSLHHSRLGFQTKRLCVCVCFVALGASWGAVYTFQECQDWRCNTKVTDIWMLLHGGVSKRASRKIAVCRHRATGGHTILNVNTEINSASFVYSDIIVDHLQTCVKVFSYVEHKRTFWRNKQLLVPIDFRCREINIMEVNGDH